MRVLIQIQVAMDSEDVCYPVRIEDDGKVLYRAWHPLRQLANAEKDENGEYVYSEKEGRKYLSQDEIQADAEGRIAGVLDGNFRINVYVPELGRMSLGYDLDN